MSFLFTLISFLTFLHNFCSTETLLKRDSVDSIVLNHPQITQMSRLRDVVGSGIFPTSKMIFMLNRELGVAVTYKDFEEHHDPKVKKMINKTFGELLPLVSCSL